MKLLKMLLEGDQSTIEDLQKQIQKLEDRHEYDVNLYQVQSQGLRSGILSSIRRRFQMELDNLQFIAKRLPPDQSESLTMIIANIKKILSDDKQ
jgi:hypothetical protein